MNDLDLRDVPTPRGLTRKEFLRGMGLLAAGAAFAGPLGGLSRAFAQDTPVKGGIFNFNLTASPPNFDPLSNSSGTVLSCIAPCYSGLVRFDPLDPNAIIPDAAKEWTVSEDGKTFTFTLFDNILFHDGQPLTSADVAFSLDRVRNPPEGVASNRQASLGVIDAIATPDATTVVITLKRPSPAFVNTLASGWMVILAKHFVEGGGDPAKDVIGSGPFKFKEYLEGVSVELERNPDYFVADRPYLDGIKGYIVPDQGAVWNYLQSGQLQQWQSIQGAEAGQYESNDDIEIVEIASTSMIGVTYNTTTAPFDNPVLRQAASLAIDRNAALDILQRGQGVFGGPLVPGPWSLEAAALEAIPGYGPDVAANLEKAKSLMAEAGFGDGVQVRMLVRRIALFEPVGVFLKDQWAKIGIDVASRRAGERLVLCQSGQEGLPGARRRRLGQYLRSRRRGRLVPVRVVAEPVGPMYSGSRRSVREDVVGDSIRPSGRNWPTSGSSPSPTATARSSCTGASASWACAATCMA